MDNQSITDQLIVHIRAREQKGIATYGHRLYGFNGRIALQDALEEALDLAQYLMQEIVERQVIDQKLTELLALLRKE